MQFVSEEELEILSKDSGVEILDAIKRIPFKEKSWIPDDCGAYILSRIDGEQYVGSSYNILKSILINDNIHKLIVDKRYEEIRITKSRYKNGAI